MPLDDSLTDVCSPSFLVQPKSTRPGMMAPTMSWALLHQITIKTIPAQTYIGARLIWVTPQLRLPQMTLAESNWQPVIIIIIIIIMQHSGRWCKHRCAENIEKIPKNHFQKWLIRKKCKQPQNNQNLRY